MYYIGILYIPFQWGESERYTLHKCRYERMLLSRGWATSQKVRVFFSFDNFHLTRIFFIKISWMLFINHIFRILHPVMGWNFELRRRFFFISVRGKGRRQCSRSGRKDVSSYFLLICKFHLAGWGKKSWISFANDPIFLPFNLEMEPFWLPNQTQFEGTLLGSANWECLGGLCGVSGRGFFVLWLDTWQYRQ